MKIVIHSHNFGQFAIIGGIKEPLVDMLSSKEFRIRRKCASQLRKELLNSLKELGWSGKTRIIGKKGLTITAVKSNVGLCLQTGNMSRFYADLLKIQTLYQREKIDAGIYIIPTKKAAKEMGNNLVNYERLVNELSVYKNIITIPILVIGLDMED